MEPHKGWLRIFDRDELTQLIERIEAEGGHFAETTDLVAGDLPSVFRLPTGGFHATCFFQLLSGHPFMNRAGDL
jgi:hypothetical protein